MIGWTLFYIVLSVLCMSCTCCVVGPGLIFLCIVRCWSCVTNGRTMDENERDAFQLLPPPPAPPQYKRSPWDSFLRHFYSKMNTIILGWRRVLSAWQGLWLQAAAWPRHCRIWLCCCIQSFVYTQWQYCLRNMHALAVSHENTVYAECPLGNRGFRHAAVHHPGTPSAFKARNTLGREGGIETLAKQIKVQAFCFKNALITESLTTGNQTFQIAERAISMVKCQFTQKY